ncbi:MAG TPA: hypothetical protein VF824_04080 [Thermoanaerobaculia bacterium]|jgi:hypothetical protein
MFRSRRDLIVPVRDRRQHRRIFTLKNAAKALIVFVVVFAGVSIANEVRWRTPAPFGRLFQHELGTADVAQPKPVEVVQEAPAPVDDQTAADPMLVAPAAREQYLRNANTNAAPPVTEASTAPAYVVAPGTPVRIGDDSKVAIVGGPDGVAIVKRAPRGPVLRGGFGR